MKKLFSVFMAILLSSYMALGAVGVSYTPPFEINAKSVYMVNLDSNMIIYSKNAQEHVDPGQLAQLMTVILTLENIPDPQQTMIPMSGIVQEESTDQYNKYGKIPLGGLRYRGEKVSAYNLMWSVMLPCASESAMMLAEYMGDGSMDYFVKMMNKRAKELGANNTNFTNPAGLPDDESFTTAYDMYLIGRHAMSIPAFEEFLSRNSYDGSSDRQESLLWISNNKLLSKSSEYYNPAITALKVASSPINGESSIVSFSKSNGYTYMTVVMNCFDPVDDTKGAWSTAAYNETGRLYTWALDTFRVKNLLEKGKNFQEIPLKLCWEKDFLRLMSADNFSALIPDEIEASSIKYELVLPSYVEAPIEKGALVGEVKLILSDQVIGRVGVVAAESAQASRFLMMLDKVKFITSTFWFKFIVVLFILLFLSYIGLTFLKNRNRRRYSKSSYKLKKF